MATKIPDNWRQKYGMIRFSDGNNFDSFIHIRNFESSDL